MARIFTIDLVQVLGFILIVPNPYLDHITSEIIKLLYNIFIQVYALLIGLAAFFSPKARLWVDGRKAWRTKLKAQVAALKPPKERIWIHCASLGEFEQGRPLIELWKKERPSAQIILSFFSPSGYEIRKDYALADVVCYLPIDTTRNAKQFLEIIQPSMAIFVKYEFWLNYLNALQKQSIPHYLIAGLFRPDQYFFKWYGSWAWKYIAGFSYFFLQNESSADLLKNKGLNNYQVVGDPRVDRVYQLSKQVKSFPAIESLIQGRKVLVVGSSWPPDEDILGSLLQSDAFEGWMAIVAPHDISASHIKAIESGLHIPYLKYSQLADSRKDRISLLIIDNIGMLSSLYQYGDIAYIGGGFGAGIHNTLEPIAFGLPVIFGPKYQKFEEAHYLLEKEGGFCVSKAEELKAVFKALQSPAQYQKSRGAARHYIDQQKGTTRKIFKYLSQS